MHGFCANFSSYGHWESFFLYFLTFAWCVVFARPVALLTWPIYPSSCLFLQLLADSWDTITAEILTLMELLVLYSVCYSYIYLEAFDCKGLNVSFDPYCWSPCFTYVQAYGILNYFEFYFWCARDILVLSDSVEFYKYCCHKSNSTFDFCFRLSLLCDGNSEIETSMNPLIQVSQLWCKFLVWEFSLVLNLFFSSCVITSPRVVALLLDLLAMVLLLPIKLIQPTK